MAKPVEAVDAGSDDVAGTAVEAGANAAAGTSEGVVFRPAGKGRPTKGRKGRNRKARNREVEATQLAAPVVGEPEPKSASGHGPRAEQAGTSAADAAVVAEPAADAAADVKPAVAETGPAAVEARSAVTEPEPAAAEAEPSGPAAVEAGPAGSAAAETEPANPAAAETEPANPAAAETEPANPAAAETKPANPAAAETEPANPVVAEAEPAAGSAVRSGSVSDTSGRDGSARRSAPRTRPAEEPTTVVAAPGLALLGKRARRVPEAARTTVAPSVGATTPQERVRAQATVVRPEPGQGDRRKRILVLVVAAVIVVVAVIFMATRNTEGGPAPRSDGVTQSATSGGSAGPTATQQQTSAPAAAPTTATPTDAATAQPGSQRPPLPAGWREYVDRTGFSVYVPANWVESRDGTMIYFRGDGRTLGIDETDRPKPDPVADWTQQRNNRLREGDFPGYTEIKIAEVPYFKKAADWEFTFNLNGGRSHVSNRGVIVGPKQAHGFWWQTDDSDWAAAAPLLQIVYDSFRPNPSRVG